MSSPLLDASALLALLNQEPGAAELAEVGAPEETIREAIEPLGLEVLDFDAELAYRTGLPRAAAGQAGLSLGDRAGLALGRRLGRPVLTADRAWLGLRVGATVRAIR